MPRRVSAVLVASLAGLGGCGPGNGLTLGPVHGSITCKGEPVRFGYVTFLPDAASGTNGPPSTGSILSDGTYSISTEQVEDGAIVGSHKVAVIALDPQPLTAEEVPKPEEDPEAFVASKDQRRRPEKEPARPPTYNARDGKTYRLLVPERLINPETSGITAKVSGGRNTINIAIKDDGSAEITY